MGLYAHAKGLTDETCYDCGYLTYGTFLCELIETAYGEKCYDMFRYHMIHGGPFTEEECKY